MASITSCPHCGSALRSDQKTCPNCGAVNPGFIVDTARTIYNPRTVEELKEYCAERNMPLRRMRFFIGEDFQEPKAFGIYRDGADFVVYKNKADGSRAVRYRGRNEAHAVHELHQKLLDECKLRGIDPDTGKRSPAQTVSSLPKPGGDDSTSGCLLALPAILLFSLFFPLFILFFIYNAIIDKIFRKEHIWPQERKRLEEKDLKQSIRFSEGLRYSLNLIRYGKPTDSSLTLRERQIKQYSRFWPALPRIFVFLLVAALLLGGLVYLGDRQNADTLYFDDGYYQIGDGKLYYHSYDLLRFNEETYSPYDYSLNRVWFVTEQDGSGSWEASDQVRLTNASGKELANNHLDKYYLGSTWDPSFGGSNFADSEVGMALQLYNDACYGVFQQGYYRIGDTLWYRDGDGQWDDWYWCSSSQKRGIYTWTEGERPLRLPDGIPLTPDRAPDYYISESWSADLGGSDYQLYAESQRASSYDKGYYRLSDGSVYYNNGSSWYRDSDYGWQYEGSSFDESDSAFSSSYSGYYLDDEWDSDWGDQSYDSWYSSQQSSSRSSSSSDSGSSWSSSDSSDSWSSWDSSETDWDSGW